MSLLDSPQKLEAFLFHTSLRGETPLVGAPDDQELARSLLLLLSAASKTTLSTFLIHEIPFSPEGLQAVEVEGLQLL